MRALTYLFQLVGFTLGGSLHIFLIVLVARHRSAGPVGKLVLAALAASGLWHTANAIELFQFVNTERQNPFLLGLAAVGLALAPSFLLHLALAWANLKNWYAIPAYVAAPVVWWALTTERLTTERTNVYSLLVGASLAAAAVLCLYAAPRRADDYERRFFRVFGWTLLAVPLMGALGSAAVVLASLAPPACFAHFVYRYNLFGLLIGRRVVFALNLGVVFALYLFVVRWVANYADEEYEVFGDFIEIALIFAAALVWLPLYGWMSRFLSKGTQLYADFSKRLIEEAARILDLEKRLQFLAEELGRSFALRRVLLLTAGDPALRGEYGPAARSEHPGALEEIKKFVLDQRFDMVHSDRSLDARLQKLLAGLGFNYLFPLWYEDHLEGLLFLDTSPRLFLDENEPILLGLSRQISHSIETCRVIEEKIGLERAMVQQEHLASLGKVAATIAHEIKNPLSSVKTLAQLMREDPEVQHRYDRDLGYMIGETDRLNRSVHQLLSFSRPLPEQREEVDVTDLLETLADLLARQYAGEQIRIEQRISQRLKLKHCNPEILKQIVLNLALNAVQASAPDGNVCLEAGVQSEGNISISVSDRGPGIPVHLHQRIFEPFFTTKQRGTGLGLAIVRKNVRHLGGEIHIESPIVEGRGTRVVVTLPAA
jgi:signal transduction histidine kinase